MMKKKSMKAFFYVIFFGCCFAIGIALGSWFSDSGRGIFALVELLVALLVSYNANVIIHETGHLVFGLLSGYHFSSFRVWSFMLVKQEGRYSLCRHKVSGTGGQCLLTPPDGEDIEAPVILYNLGGCIFNLILSSACIAFYISLDNIPVLSAILLLTAIFSTVTLITNGLPIMIGGIPNDGLNARVLSKDKASKVAFLNELRVADAQVRGIRLSDMPDEWFSVPEDVSAQNLFYSTIKVFGCNRTLDSLDTVKCEAEIETLLNSNWLIIGLHRSLLTIDLIYCRLVNHGAGKDYRSLVTQDVRNVMKSMKRNPSILRTEYAAELLYDGNKTRADVKLREFEEALKTHPYPADSELERQLVELALNKYNSKNDR